MNWKEGLSLSLGGHSSQLNYFKRITMAMNCWTNTKSQPTTKISIIWVTPLCFCLREEKANTYRKGCWPLSFFSFFVRGRRIRRRRELSPKSSPPGETYLKREKRDSLQESQLLIKDRSWFHQISPFFWIFSYNWWGDHNQSANLAGFWLFVF